MQQPVCSDLFRSSKRSLSQGQNDLLLADYLLGGQAPAEGSHKKILHAF